MGFFIVAFSFRIRLLMPTLLLLLMLVSLPKSCVVVLLSSSPSTGELLSVRYGLWVAPARGARFLFFVGQASFVVISFHFRVTPFLCMLHPALGLSDCILFRRIA